jgi:hypothetical protein
MLAEDSATPKAEGEEARERWASTALFVALRLNVVPCRMLGVFGGMQVMAMRRMHRPPGAISAAETSMQSYSYSQAQQP